MQRYPGNAVVARCESLEVALIAAMRVACALADHAEARSYRVVWQIDVETPLAAAREAWGIMKRPYFGEPDSANVLDVFPADELGALLWNGELSVVDDAVASETFDMHHAGVE